MRLVCIMLSAGMKTLRCRAEWSQLLLLPCCPTSEMKGCCSNPQFTLILLRVDFRAFTYNCNVKFCLMPATCIILLLWVSPVETTGWTLIYTKPKQAAALLLLCSGKPRQHTGRNVICHQHLHSCFLRCCRSRCCTATMKISGKAEGFRQVFSAVIEVWFSWCSNGLSSFPCISRVSLLCNKRQLKLIPRVWGFFLYPGNLVRKDYSEILPIGCCLVETITVGEGNSIGLKLAGIRKSSIWTSRIYKVMELRSHEMFT